MIVQRGNLLKNQKDKKQKRGIKYPVELDTKRSVDKKYPLIWKGVLK